MANFSGKYVSNKRWGGNKTITVDNTMTIDEINAAVYTYGRYIPNGSTLIINFNSGTYTIASPLKFNGFHGDGVVLIKPSSSYTAGFNDLQPVFISAGSSSYNAVEITANFVRAFRIEGFKVQGNTSGNHSCLYCLSNSYVNIFYSWLLGTGTGGGHNFMGSAGRYFSYYNNIENALYGLMGNMGVFVAQNNKSANTYPAYGIGATNGGTVARLGTTPLGSTANTIVTNGGEIR